MLRRSFVRLLSALPLAGLLGLRRVAAKSPETEWSEPWELKGTFESPDGSRYVRAVMCRSRRGADGKMVTEFLERPRTLAGRLPQLPI